MMTTVSLAHHSEMSNMPAQSRLFLRIWSLLTHVCDVSKHSHSQLTYGLASWQTCSQVGSNLEALVLQVQDL